MKAGNSKDTFMVLSIFLYPIISFYWHHRYPFFSLETVIIFASAFLLAVLASSLVANSNEKIGNCLIAGVLVFVGVIQFDLLLAGLATAVVAVLGVAILLSGKNFRLLATVVMLALILGAFLDNNTSFTNNRKVLVNPNQDETLPPIVHLILDSFIGPAGLPPQIQAQEFKFELMDFMQRNQFSTYTQAYTHYAATQDSLTNALNFKSDSKDIFHENEAFHNRYVLETNKYLELLMAQGYSIQVFQSEFIDFCHSLPHPAQRCWTYTIPNVATIHEGVSRLTERIKLLFQLIIYQSNTLKSYAKRSQWYEDNGITFYDNEILKAIGDHMGKTPYGNVYFAHLLLPHGPFVFRADCSFDYETDQWSRYAHSAGLISNIPEVREIRYIKYLEQTTCTLKILDEFFDNLRSSGIYDEAVILLHGDHGSTIVQFPITVFTESLLSDTDYLDAFSTLFAVKFPGSAAKIITETSPLEILLNQILGNLIDKPLPSLPNAPFIYMSDGVQLHRKDMDIFSQQLSD